MNVKYAGSMNALSLHLPRECQSDSVGMAPNLHLPVIVISYLEEASGHEPGVPCMCKSETMSLQRRARRLHFSGSAGGPNFAHQQYPIPGTVLEGT